MQSKGAITFLGILFVLACVYQLSFTLVTQNAEKNAQEASGGNAESYQNYLDSIANEPVYNLFVKEYTFRESKERELNLGLDLKGGMNVTLEVSVVDLIRSLSNNSTDATFNKALAEAQTMQKNSQKDFVTLFGEAFSKVDPNAKLAAVFSTMELQDRINFNSTNEQVIAVIREDEHPTTGLGSHSGGTARCERTRSCSQTASRNCPFGVLGNMGEQGCL